MMDNLQGAYEEGVSYYWFTYHNLLDKLINNYCKFIGYPAIKFHKSFEILTSPDMRKKYLLPNFPNEKFVDIAKTAIIESDKDNSLRLYEELTKHVLNKMSGFDIDGWKLRSRVSYD